MNWLGIILMLIGIFHLIYAVLHRHKVAYYTRRYSKVSEMKVVKLSEFLRLQLYFSVFNSLFLVICGLLIGILNLDNVFFLIGYMLFGFINFLLVVVSKNKGYVNYKVGKTYK
ncbi:MAG: hypothetical protein K0S71_210 [Clostridia bacterium]|jgi:hypothetical protein|nr:hypothetical protein [Clostridia bacterium]